MAEIVDFGLQQHKIKMDSRYFENVLSVVAGDTGRRLEVQLLDTNGMIQDTTGLNLRLNAEIAGKTTFTDATLVDAATGKYQLDLSNGMFLAPGNWQFQWQITDSLGKKLHSFAFTGNIGKNISEGGSQATNFYLNLDDLKAMQEDLINGTFDSEALETNISEKLTNLETQYAPRLNEVTAQLAQKANQSDLNITDGRINTLIALPSGSTNNDARLEDIKIGADGKTYDSPANAVREQFKDANDEILELDGRLFDTSTNLYNDETKTENYMYTSAGVLTRNELYIMSDFIKVEGNTSYYYNKFLRVSYFDKDNNWIGMSELYSPDFTYPTPNNAKYIRVQGLRNVVGNTGQVNKGNLLLPFERYYKILKGFSNEPRNTKTISLDLEADGINKNDGKIKQTEIVGDLDDIPVNRFKTTSRTGKYLNVISSSKVTLGYDVGDGFIFEYDTDFNYLGYQNILSQIPLSLSANTRLIKVLMENLPEYNKQPKLTYVPASESVIWSFNERYKNGVGNINSTSKNINFVYEASTNEEQYAKERFFNSGLLRLPPNYKTNGDPVKLIIYSKSSGDFNSFHAKYFGYAYEKNIDYLVDEGYAVLSVYDWTTKYQPSTMYDNTGSPISYTALASGYDWVVKNYNIDKNGTFVTGKSAGGYQGFGLAYNKGIPVKAVGLLCPTISPMTTRLHSRPEVRKALADDYGFVGDYSILDNVSGAQVGLRDFFMLNAPKMVGYNSYWDGLINSDLSTLMGYGYDTGQELQFENYSSFVRVCNTPIKIWSAKDDHVSSLPPQHEIYIQTIKNGNGIGELRWMPIGTGGHNSVDSSPDALKVDEITTKLGIKHTGIALAYVELVSWFRRFGGI